MADHVTFGPATLIGGALGVTIFGLLTIGSQTIRASKANAATLLKFE
jgi:hypothetical protein